MAERTSSSAVVDAPPDRVLAVVADLEDYPAWAASVREVEVLKRGAGGLPARARFRVEGGPLADEYVLAYAWDVADDGTGDVRWDVDEPGRVVADLDGSYALRARDDGGTDVRYDLGVELRVPLPGLLRRRAERTVTSTALTELARRAARG
ncbi:SRPBCC family protein [Pseudokineococcus basanitobsidens]|uniref:SRPBCC family protein n=1 Tax=Pseudokineococcus basanitobsidens TaxID=1926649 RepID=A0ABU8RJ83_9ACTN